MTTTTFTIHDDADEEMGLYKGPNLQVSVTDDTFAYGLELAISAGDKQIAVLMLDYFEGKLAVRHWDEEADDYIGMLQVLDLRDTTKETTDAL